MRGGFHYAVDAGSIGADWGGRDEMDEASGELGADLDGDELTGSISFHGSDESGFVARRWRPQDGPTSR